MSRVLRVITCVGLILCRAMLAYCFSMEQTGVLTDAPGANKSRMRFFLAATVAVGGGPGLLCAYDFTQFLSDRAPRFLLFGGRETFAIPEIDRAVALLRRVWDEHGGTSAAINGRKRLIELEHE